MRKEFIKRKLEQLKKEVNNKSHSSETLSSILEDITFYTKLLEGTQI